MNLQQRNEAQDHLDDFVDADLRVIVDLLDGINAALGLNAELIKRVRMLSLLGVLGLLVARNTHVFQPGGLTAAPSTKKEWCKGAQHAKQPTQTTALAATRRHRVNTPHLPRQRGRIHAIGPIQLGGDGVDVGLDAGDVGKRNAWNCGDLARDGIQAFFDLRISHEC